MPVYMFSLAELDLLMAEIELKGLATTGEKAEDHMKDAVIHSTNYWYALNAASDYKSKITAVGGVAALYPTKPTDAIIARWGDVHKDNVELDSLSKKIVGLLKETLGLSTVVKLLPPRTLPRSQGKALRVIDKRKMG